MTHHMKKFSGIAFAVLALLAAPAQAVTVSFGGQSATQGSTAAGLTSSFVSAANTAPAGYLIETFDGATGCAINTLGTGVAVTETGGGFDVRQGTVSGVAAAPAGDATCFGFGPQQNGALPASVKFDFSGLLTPGVSIDYFGLYYGSIDTYNDIAFYSGNNLITVVTGTSILTALGGVSGNQLSDKSNVYVNLNFAPAEAFTSFEFRTTGVAFEFDNVVLGLNNRVPEPASLALLGAGLFGIAAARRRKAKAA